MTKQKACKICNAIYDSGEKCPKCGAREASENFKGRIVVMDPEKSELAGKLKLRGKGNYAIKTR
jgi:DNA-directed RNA polymerase subunit E"